MQRARRYLTSVLTTSIVIAVATVHAATPPVQVNAPPKLKIEWLSQLSVSPASTPAGATITGTVTLLRNAIESVQVSLQLAGASPDESGHQTTSGVLAPTSVAVPAGSRQATFQVYTSNHDSLPKTFTLTARYGNETKTATFTVNKPRRTTTLPG